MQAARKLPARGFTLVELMVVVVIATILISVAMPSYIQQMRQSRRTDAKTALLDLAGREERYLSTAANGGNYSVNPVDLGYPVGSNWPLNVGSGYYQVTVCVTAAGAAAACPPSAAPGPSYTITATPVAGTSQASDTQCTSFSVDSVGQQYATGAQNAAYCWGN
jgi:type IV pilus assembly protein PilE